MRKIEVPKIFVMRPCAFLSDAQDVRSFCNSVPRRLAVEHGAQREWPVALDHQPAGILRLGPRFTNEVRGRRADSNVPKAMPLHAVNMPRHNVLRGIDVKTKHIFDEVGDGPDSAPTN